MRRAIVASLADHRTRSANSPPRCQSAGRLSRRTRKGPGASTNSTQPRLAALRDQLNTYWRQALTNYAEILSEDTNEHDAQAPQREDNP
jgi:hypothetical protein